jgi:predicted deacetylase
MTSGPRHAVVSIHDVAPATLVRVAGLRAVVREIAGPVPVSLLVVPCYHGSSAWDAEAATWVRACAADGDEIVLHGHLHHRPGGGDGPEFGRTTRPADAQARIGAGRRRLEDLGISPEGFIAPAYAHPRVLTAALHDHGMGWWATRTWLHSCDGSRRLLPSLGLGASTAPRRALSPAAARAGIRFLQHAPAVRIDLHPADLDHGRLRAAVPDILARLLDGHRTCITHADLCARDV